MLSWRQLQLVQEAQITNRYEAAVRQLASPTSTERIGGIYALGRIAKDSSRDEHAIVSLLSAFCRDQSTVKKRDDPDALARRHADVQIALEVIGSRSLKAVPILHEADLHGADLQTATLRTADLRSAVLNCGNLKGADLVNARLSSARLRGADLRNANLAGASLDACDLTDAHLEGANLAGCYYTCETTWPTGFVPPGASATRPQ